MELQFYFTTYQVYQQSMLVSVTSITHVLPHYILGVLTAQDLHILTSIMKPAAPQWQAIGGALGLLPSDLTIIQQSPLLISQGPPGYFREMLSQWLNWAPPDHPWPTLEALEAALRSSGSESLAFQLRSLFVKKKGMNGSAGFVIINTFYQFVFWYAVYITIDSRVTLCDVTSWQHGMVWEPDGLDLPVLRFVTASHFYLLGVTLLNSLWDTGRNDDQIIGLSDWRSAKNSRLVGAKVEEKKSQ